MPETEISVKLLQRCIIWWLWKHDKGIQEILFELTAVFMEDTYSVDAIRYWLKSFQSGRTQIGDLKRCGRPRDARTQENIEAVVECVTSDRQQTVNQMALKLQISHTTVQRILRKDLNMKKKAAKFVPKLLTDQHKQCRVDACNENLFRRRLEPRLFERIVTGDESYFHLYEPETKKMSKQWLQSDDPRPQKALRDRGTYLAVSDDACVL